MQRSISRQRKLPAFSLNIADLEVLLQKLESLFNSKPTVRISLDLPKSENLVFESIEELKEYRFSKNKLTKIRISCSESVSNRAVRISTSFFSGIGTISADAESEAWCAGALETGYSFLQSYKSWYWWLYTMPLGIILFLLFLIPLAASMFIPGSTRLPGPVAAAYTFAFSTLSLLFLSREYILPGTVLRVSEEPNFFRRNLGELGLLVAVISMIISAVALLTTK